MNISKLTSMSWENWQPVTLHYEKHELELIECLRLLPGKRCAAKATWNGKAVFAKVFFNATHKKSASLESDYLESLKQFNARVPTIIGVYRDGDSSVLVTEWLEEAESLEHLIEVSENVLMDALEQVQKIYDAGYAQRDIHLGNFVVSDSKAWIVDVADIAVLSSTESMKNYQVSENLALLCAQVSLSLADKVTSIVFQVFSKYLGSEEVFRKSCDRLRNKRIKKAIKKWSRESSSIALIQQDNKRVLFDRVHSDKVDDFLQWADEPSSLEQIKEGSKVSVYGNQEWIVKHYHKIGLKEKIKGAFGLGHARCSWVMGWTLAMLGLPTPRPVVCAEYKNGSAVVVTPRLEGTRLSDMMEGDRESAKRYYEIVKQWIELAGSWGFWHGDLKAQNIICVSDQSYFIDLDDAGWTQRENYISYKHKRDVERLEKNWQQFVAH